MNDDELHQLLTDAVSDIEPDDRIDELAPRLEEHVRRKLEIARPGYSEGE